MPQLLSVFHSLPAFARTLVASAYGYRLRQWRFGPDAERLVEEALERETWSAARLQAWCDERLAFILHRAAAQVPYYRQLWSRRRQAGDRRSYSDLENWPLLERTEVRANPEAFLVEGCDPGRMHLETTSGTTGTPVRIWESRETTRAWYALVEARQRRWHGVSRHDRWALLGGRLVTPVGRREPPFWLWNGGLRQLYVSSHHLSPEFIPAILDALERYEVRYVAGYTASLNALAQEALRIGRKPPVMRVVLTEAEAVFAHQRAAIEKAFGCAVRETYGMCEHVGGASEGPCGNLHLWPEAGRLEVVAEGVAQRAGCTGELVFTGLLNADMPLIRYRLGDRGSLAGSADCCSCGKGLPVLRSLDGRLADVLHTADGRVLSPNVIDIVLTPDLPIREAQIVQKSLRALHVRYVPAAGQQDNTVRRRLTDALGQRFGPVDVTFEPLDCIPRGPNGKFKVVASERNGEASPGR